LSGNDLHRIDVREALRIFRPVLKAVKIREQAGQTPVFLAEFDNLAFLNLEECSIQFSIGNINVPSLFIIKYTNTKLLRAYIILNRNLYDSQSKSMREIRKIAGVHEFVHFIAMIYLATTVGTPELRETLKKRLHNHIDRLWGPNVWDIFSALSGQNNEFTPPELTHSHFKLGLEGQTPDYGVLFLHLMFSRELFEEYFDQARQAQFRNLFTTGRRDAAIRLLFNTLAAAADDKDVPMNTAKNQLFEWAHIYMKAA
jgi:hypothetical protein